jgi:hypothetical protein
MPKDIKLYDYIHSEKLNLEIAVAKNANHVWTEDGVRYNSHELNELKKAGEITPLIHSVKKIFTKQNDGGIVEVNRNGT